MPDHGNWKRYNILACYLQNIEQDVASVGSTKNIWKTEFFFCVCLFRVCGISFCVTDTDTAIAGLKALVFATYKSPSNASLKKMLEWENCFPVKSRR